jgi:hypothetical protein
LVLARRKARRGSTRPSVRCSDKKLTVTHLRFYATKSAAATVNNTISAMDRYRIVVG